MSTFSFGLLTVAAAAVIQIGCTTRDDCAPGRIVIELSCPDGQNVDKFTVHLSDVTQDAAGTVDVPASCPITKLNLLVPRYTRNDEIHAIATAYNASGAVVGVPQAVRFQTEVGCTFVSSNRFTPNVLSPSGDGGTADVRRVDGPFSSDSSPAPACTSGVSGLPKGVRCACDDQCGNGHCVDGVCCDDACNGTCKSCTLTGREGTCSFIPDGMPPRQLADCEVNRPETCATDGMCNGAGQCRMHPDGTVCDRGKCDGTKVVNIRKCAAGKCGSQMSVTSCAPYTCDPKVVACTDSCTTNEQCAPGTNCTPAAGSAQGSCGIKPRGARCGVDGECETGFCVDKVCCDAKCGDACHACNLVGHEGSCTTVAGGTSDPRGACLAADRNSCGTTGVCDASGKCAKYASGTQCGEATCTAGAAVPAPTCDGNGTCKPSSALPCGKFACTSGACRSPCSTNADCSAGNVCDNTGSCGLKEIGQKCNAGSECMQGKCVDGVCCSSECAGGCRSCNLPGTAGTCTNVASGNMDPRGTCKSELATNKCGQNGLCDGVGGCLKAASGTLCASESCSSDVYTPSSMCDGTGLCRAAATNSCGNYRCNGTTCGSSCTNDLDCSGTNSCVNFRCGLQPNGATCTSANRCSSSSCVQNVCCDKAACGGPCDSCATGTCVNVCQSPEMVLQAQKSGDVGQAPNVYWADVGVKELGAYPGVGKGLASYDLAPIPVGAKIIKAELTASPISFTSVTDSSNHAPAGYLSIDVVSFAVLSEATAGAIYNATGAYRLVVPPAGSFTTDSFVADVTTAVAGTLAERLVQFRFTAVGARMYVPFTGVKLTVTYR